jgi:NADH:ubiquinone oxidoreductase subunit 6 (subunit J)
MIISNNKWKVWASISILAFLGAIISLFNFWSAIDLGYDGSSRGRLILKGWGYAMLFLIVCGIVFIILSTRSWYLSRKINTQEAEKTNKTA